MGALLGLSIFYLWLVGCIEDLRRFSGISMEHQIDINSINY